MIMDKESALKEIVRSKPDYSIIDNKLWYDDEFVYIAIREHESAYMWLPDDRRDDPKVLQYMIETHETLSFDLFYPSGRAQKNIDFMKAWFKKATYPALSHCNDETRDNLFMAMIAIEANKRNLCYVSDRLLKYPRLVAMGITVESFDRLPEEFKTNEYFLRCLITNDSRGYKLLPDCLQVSKDILLKVFTDYQKYVDIRDMWDDKKSFPDIWKHEDVNLEFFRRGILPALNHLNVDSLSEEDIFFSLKSNHTAKLCGRRHYFTYYLMNKLPERYNEDKDFLIKALRYSRDSSVMSKATGSFLMDKGFATYATKIVPSVFKYMNAGNYLHDDRKIALRVAECGIRCMNNPVMQEYKKDLEIVVTAVYSNLENYLDLPIEMKNCEIVKLAWISHCTYPCDVDETWDRTFNDDKYHQYLEYIIGKEVNNESFIEKAILINPDVAFVIGDILNDNTKFMCKSYVKKALKHKSKAKKERVSIDCILRYVN